jgi:hypothetical protein
MADQFPRGKLNADDEGELNVRIGVRDKTLVIDFGKPTVWIGLDKHTALALAATIKKRAEEI